MKNCNSPIERYASLASLEELQIEKLKLKSRISRQEETLKTQIDNYLNIFSWIGDLSLIAKQVVASIPYFRFFKIIIKLINTFWKK